MKKNVYDMVFGGLIFSCVSVDGKEEKSNRPELSAGIGSVRALKQAGCPKKRVRGKIGYENSRFVDNIGISSRCHKTFG